MDTVKWGILSTATIATGKVIPGMKKADSVELVAIASRSIEKAKKAAADAGIPRAYGSYEELLADADVQAVYIPLPNHMHVEWSIKAIEAGKHVLCEKPIGLSSAEAEKLRDAAAAHPKLKVMEAFMYRHHPQWVRAKALVTEGAIGTLKMVQAAFAYNNTNPDDIRNQAEIGGGGLMDIGCYPISVSRFFFESEPARVAAAIEWDPKFKTDTYGACLLEFQTGRASFTYSTQLEPLQRVIIGGTTGHIEIMIPFNAPPDRPCVMYLSKHGSTECLEIPTADQYGVQGELMSQAILKDAPVPTPLDDAVANMKVIERCFEAAKTGGWA